MRGLLIFTYQGLIGFTSGPVVKYCTYGICLEREHLFVCYSCSCPVGFEGPRCQQTKITFADSSGYIVLKPLESRERDKLSFEFMTTTSTGTQMLFYTGPMSDPPSSDPSTLKDFMAVELVNGYPRLQLSLGDQKVTIPPLQPSSSLSDGNWHSVEIYRMGKVSGLCRTCYFSLSGWPFTWKTC